MLEIFKGYTTPIKSPHVKLFITAIELIKDLMEYSVQGELLKCLVSALVPSKEDLLHRPEILDGNHFLSLIVLTVLWVGS